ncbi:MAG: peroxiredoxin [Paracoccus sp. (in: a-proteobacteria)]|nr:peroxiredoxin [Paracoccus sp. (in: a-proteobacteria)]
MMLQQGNKLPSGNLLEMTASGPKPVDMGDYARGRVAIFALPGAYTGTCSTQHVPSFIRTADAFRTKGVDRIVCISVNDPFVMGAWAKDTGADKAGLTFLADADGSFTRAMGASFDAPPVGLIGRSKRYAMLVEDGVITVIQAEENPGECAISGGEALLKKA